MNREPPAALFICSLVLLLAACGSVGDPRPPLLDIPGRVEDFAAWQDGADLQAAWTWPALGSEGQIYRDLERFEIWAVDFPESAPLPPPEVWQEHGEIIATVGPEALDETTPGGRVSARAPLRDRIGKRTLFAVRGVSDRGKAAAWSAPAAFHVVAPSPPPDAVRAEATPEGVLVRWEALPEVSSYEIQRRVGDGDFLPLAETSEPEHVDRGPLWGELHEYRVRGRRASDAAHPVAGAFSETFALTPEDRFAPASPRELRAVATPTAVELSWTSNQESDLAGFFVLRGEERINTEPIEAAAFSDPSVSPATAYRYSVIAVDRLGNESAPSDAVEIVTP